MTTTFTAKADCRFSWDYRNVLDLATIPDQANLRNNNRDFTNGTGINQANFVWHDRRRLTPATGTDDIDLSGVLTDGFGNTLNILTVKGIYIENRGVLSAGVYVPTDGEDIQVGGAGDPTNAWAAFLNDNQDAEVTIRSGGVMMLTSPLSGYSVVAGSLDILRVLLDGSGSNDVYYDIAIFGTR
jgi:hypothetical protein